MRIKILSVLILMVLASTTVCEAKMTAKREKIPGGYNFWLYEPDNTNEALSTDKKPLIIFLHGQSLCGTDLDKVMSYGTMDAIKSGRNLNAYVLGPQNPGGAWKPSKVAELIDWAIKNYPIDTNRIYLLGMSLGAYGTIDFVATYPKRVAAAMAFCGGGSVKDYSGLCSVPLWIIHGTADDNVHFQNSMEMCRRLNAAGKHYDMMVYPDQNHSMRPSAMTHVRQKMIDYTLENL